MYLTTIKYHKQTGAVLFVSLVMLLLMTLIGVTGMRTTTLEEKISGNLRNKNIAFQSAEAALRAGEVFVAPGLALPPFDGNNGLYQQDLLLWSTVDWSTGAVQLAAGLIPEVGSNLASFYIEELGSERLEGGPLDLGVAYSDPKSMINYRVTARGLGPNGASETILQTTAQR